VETRERERERLGAGQDEEFIPPSKHRKKERK
jgi:hypothetical protein